MVMQLRTRQGVLMTGDDASQMSGWTANNTKKMAETFKDNIAVVNIILTTANTAREVKIWCWMYATRGDLATHIAS